MSETKPSQPSINPYDLEQARKKVRHLLRSNEGVIAFREGLLLTQEGRGLVKQEFGISVVHRDEPRKPIVAICIPTHKKPENETGSALDKMLPVAREVCHPTMRPLVASSVVHWVRNQLLATLYASDVPFDYVLFMDDDMVPPPDALNVLLSRKVDVIGAVCTVRQDPPLPNARHFNEERKYFQTADIDRPGVWKVGAIGTGFMLISKKALDDIGEYTLSQRYFRERLGMAKQFADQREMSERQRASKDHNKFWFEFLKDPSSGELGEDISFCLKARECGYEIYADSTIQVGHVGNYAYSLEDYWYYRGEAVQRGLVVPVASQHVIAEYTSDTRISLLVPTRGRPDNIVRLLNSLHETSHVMPEIVFRIDDDDEASKSALDQLRASGEPVEYVCGPRGTMTTYWNEASTIARGDVMMFAADDLVFRTKGWDSLVRKTFDEHPDKLIFAHGDDGYWGAKFGTHGFLHRKWVDAIGYVLPPYFSSDFGDTWINDVANALERRVVLPIVTEHMHFLFGKAQKDQTYSERLARGDRDGVQELYSRMEPKRAEDVEKLRAALYTEAVVG